MQSGLYYCGLGCKKGLNKRSLLEPLHAALVTHTTERLLADLLRPLPRLLLLPLLLEQAQDEHFVVARPAMALLLGSSLYNKVSDCARPN